VRNLTSCSPSSNSLSYNELALNRHVHLTTHLTSPFDPYESCPLSIQPFWISREPVVCPWCNLAANERRPYCASVNSHSPVGLVSRQWDGADLCAVWPSCSKRPSEQISFITTMRLPILQLSCRLFCRSITSPRSVSPLQPRFGFLRLLAFPKAKIAVEMQDICECDGHTVTSSVNCVSLPTD